MKNNLLILLSVFAVFFISCETVERGKIVSTDFTGTKELADGRLLTTDVFVHAFINEHDDQLFRIRKGINEDKRFSEAEKQRLIEQLKEFSYEPMRYMVFRITFRGSEILSDDSFLFDFRDTSGNTIIEKHLRYNYRAEYGTNGSTWMIKLKKPFTAKEYAPAIYNFKATFPGGKNIVWELTVK